MPNMTERMLIEALPNTKDAYKIGVLNNLLYLETGGVFAVVRFGITGTGKRPHYQIDVNEVMHTFRGDNHNAFGIPSFDEKDITDRRFTREELRQLFGR